MSRGRYYRAVVTGARPLDQERWGKLVDEATQSISADFKNRVFEPATPTRDYRESRHVRLRPTDFVISAQTILDVEAALALALESVAEIEALAKHDLDSARRARLAKTIEHAIAKIRKRLEREPS